MLVGAAHTPAKQGKVQSYKFPDSVKQTGIQKEGGKELQRTQSPVRKAGGGHKMKDTEQSKL